MKKAILKLAKNKYVFYFFVVLAVLNILGYVSMRSGMHCYVRRCCIFS